MRSAEINDGLVDARVTAVRNDGNHILRLARGVPHLAALAQHRGHGCIHDDIARHMKVGDALVAIDHGDRGAMRVDRLNVCLDGSAFGSRKRGDLGNQVAESVLNIHADPFERCSMFGEYWLEIRAYGMTKDDRVRDLHHGGLQMQREQQPRGASLCNLRFKKRDQLVLTEERSVNDVARVEFDALLEHCHGAASSDVFNTHCRSCWHGNGAFITEEIAMGHGGNVRLAVLAPCAHLVRICACVILDGVRRAAIGVALADHRIHCAALNAVIAGLGVAFDFGLRFIHVSRDGVALLLQFHDRRLQLRYRRTDVWQLDDVGTRSQAQATEFSERIGNALLRLQTFGEAGDDAASQRNVPQLNRNSCGTREGANDRQK